MKLTENFMATKQFCDTHELKINMAKTQLVIFKSASKVVPPDFELLLDGCPIKPVRSMKILGVTLDHASLYSIRAYRHHRQEMSRTNRFPF